MKSICRNWFLFIPAILIALSGTVFGVDDQENQPVQSFGPLRFQRLFVPADRPESWPRKAGEHYFPMSAEEFENRVAALQSHPTPSKTSGAWLKRATYTAEFRNGNLLVGNAEWELERRVNGPTVAVLGQCNLAVMRPIWIDAQDRERSDTKGSSKPVVGATADGEAAIVGNDQLGRLVAIVDRVGLLTCGWQISGELSSPGYANFPLKLPACASSVLKISLPKSLRPEIEHGLVALQESSEKSDKWRIDLGGANSQTLRIVERNNSSSNSAVTRTRTSIEYDISERRLELTARIKFEVGIKPLRQIRLLLDPALEDFTAYVGDSRLNVALGTKTSDGSQSVIVEIPPELVGFQGESNELSVSASAPIILNRPWTLPVVQTEGAWEQGRATLRIRPPLKLSDLNLIDCIQSPIEVAQSETDRLIDIRFSDPRPEIVLALSRRQPQTTENGATVVSLRANEGLGRYIAEFNTSDGVRFSFDAEIATGWVIDGVESVPQGLIADWSQESAIRGPGKLKLQLAAPNAAGRPIRLSITGRRRRAALGDTFGNEDLRMLRFAGVRSERHLIHIQAIEPYLLQVDGDERLTRIGTADTTPQDAVLLGERLPGLTFLDDPSVENLGVSIIAKGAQYEADIQSEANVSDGVLLEAYRFAITPLGREITKLNIRFSQPRQGLLSWSIDGDPAVRIVARKVPEEGTSRTNPVGELWEVALSSPRNSPFVMVASRRSIQRGETPLALAALADAEAQRGTFQINSTTDYRPEIRSTRRLKSIPVNADATSEAVQPLAAFQYNPEEDALSSAEPPLVLAIQSNNRKSAQAWIWSAKLDSQFGASNVSNQLAVSVETAGRAQIKFQPPPGATFRQLRINNRLAADEEFDNAKDGWQVNLPPGDRFVELTLEWNESRTSGQLFSLWQEAIPACDVPILSKHWSVHLPPAALLADTSTHSVSSSWLQRLFGPLARGGELSANSAAYAGDGNGGWTTWEFESSGAEPMTIWICDARICTAWAWAAFLLVMSLRWCAGHIKPICDHAAFVSATALALLVSPMWVPITAAAWLGLLAGRLLVACRQMLPVVEGAADTSRLRQTASVVGVQIALFAVLAGQLSLYAADKDISSLVAQIIVPVDPQNHSASKTYFLPESFRDKLNRLSETYAAGPADYVIYEAHYTGEIQWSSKSDELETVDWNGHFEVYSLVEQARVSLAIGSRGAALIPDGVLVDGQPALFQSTGEGGLLVVLEKKGKHKIDVRYRPIVDRGAIDFTVPPVPGARMTIKRPAAVPLVIGASGENSEIEEAGTIEKTFGPSTRIVVRQPKNRPAAMASAVEFDVDELCWLLPQSGETMIDARFNINVKSGRLQQLRLHVDPRLQLQSSTVAGEAVNSAPASDGSGDLILELPHPISKQGTVDVKFQMLDAPEIGNWFLPQLSVRGASNSRQFWAASFEGETVATARKVEGMDLIAAEKFGVLWGSNDNKPEITWEKTGTPQNPFLATRLPEVRVDAEYEFAVLAGAREAFVQWKAKLNSNGELFQCQIAVPPELKIERVSLPQVQSKLLHWSRSNPNTVTVFFDSPNNRASEIILVGRLQVASEGKFKLPVIHVLGAQSEKFQALIFRRHSALVEIADSAGLAHVPQSELPTLAANFAAAELFGKLNAKEAVPVAAFRGEGFIDSAVLHVTPNEADARAIQAVTMLRGDNGWAATVDLSLNVEQGLVDVLRFDLSPNWIGPFEVLPAMSANVEDGFPEGSKQLVLRPEKALSSELKLRISGPVTVPSGQRPSVPDIRLADTPRLIRFVLLPRRAGNQQLEWGRRSLVPRPPPAALNNILGNSNTFRSYQVRDNFRAQLRSVEQRAEAPQVHLAEIALSLQSDGSCSGVAAIDLKPGDVTSFQIEAAPNCDIVQATLDGVPAQLATLSEGNWTLAIGNNPAPRHLELIFRGKLVAGSAGEWLAAVPRFVGIPVEQTLWTISNPSGAGELTVLDGEIISAAKANSLRIESMDALADSALQSLRNETSDDMESWYRPWGERYAVYRAASKGEMNDSKLQANKETDSVPAPTVVNKGSFKLPADFPGELEQARRPVKNTLDAEWLSLAIPRTTAANTLNVVSKVGGASLRIFCGTAANDFSWRLAATIVLVTLCVGLTLALQRGLVSLHVFSSWPQVAGAMAGVAWWFWLAPSWVGLIILAASIYFAWQPSWPAAAPRPDSSTIRPFASSPSKRLGNSGRK